MTGYDIRSIRTALGLSASRFATVLGVHPSSVHRWEAAGDGQISIEGIPLNVLLALEQRLASRPKKDAKDVGGQVMEALLVGGALAGLALLIGYALKGK